MKQYKNRPIIEASDSPLIVDEALHSSIRYWDDNMPSKAALAWQKKAADAQGAVEDGFSIIGSEVHNPEGNALLYVSPDELGLALVAYGCELIDDKISSVYPKILAIDGLLRQIDAIKSA